MTPTWSLLFVMHWTIGSAAGLLAGANFDIAAATVKVITPTSTVHFFHSSSARSRSPPPIGRGEGTEWVVMPSKACVRSVNSFVVSPGRQRNMVKTTCSVIVPVSIPSIAVFVCSFSSLALVSPLWLDQFQTELQHHPTRQQWPMWFPEYAKAFVLALRHPWSILRLSCQTCVPPLSTL